MNILIDTNILLRRAQPASPQHQVAQQSLLALVRAEIEICLVPQVIYEYWVAATRPTEVNGLGMDVPSVQKSIDVLLQDFVLLKDERGIFGNWQSLVVAQSVKGKSAHDARLVAAMQRHGISNVLTFNGPDFTRFNSVEVFSPADVLAGRLPS